MPGSTVGDIHVFELADGRWGALQLTRVTAKELSVEVLDWVGDGIPSLEQMGELRPMQLERFQSSGRPCEASVGRSTVPPHFPLVGRVPREPAQESNSTVVWGYFPATVQRELRWREASDGARGHFLCCSENRQATIELSDHGVVKVMRKRVAIDLRTFKGAFDWSQLDQLGALLVLEVHGAALGLAAYLAGRELVRHLVWREPKTADLDLRGAGLDEVDLELGESGPATLRVDPCLGQLRLRPDDAERLTVDHPEGGRGATLRVEACAESHPGVIPGLEGLTGLVLARPRKLEVGRLAGYEKLQHFWARLAPGEVVDADGFAVFSDLRSLQLDDAYEMDAVAFPSRESFPALDEVYLNGLRREDAKILKKTYRGTPDLVVRNAKGAAWVRAYLQSPFRNWDEEVGARQGKAACRAYEKAAKLAGSGKEHAEATLRTFLETFEKIHARQALDTDQREEVGEAFHQIAAELGIKERQAAEWFDAWRSF